MDIATVAVPDLVGQFVHIARDEALKMGLDLASADPDGVPITARTWPGLYCVTSQHPAPGTLVHRGDQIRVTFVEDGQARGDVAAFPTGPVPFLSAHAEPDEVPGVKGARLRAPFTADYPNQAMGPRE